MVATASTEQFLLAGACVCCVKIAQSLAFLAVFVYATHATQAIAFDWKPGFSQRDWGAIVIITISLSVCVQKARQIAQWLVGRPTTHSSGSGCLTQVPIVLSRQRANTPALQLAALNDVGARLHLSYAICRFASVTHFYMDYCSFIDPLKDERLSWPHWLTHSGQFTHKVVIYPIISQAENR